MFSEIVRRIRQAIEISDEEAKIVEDCIPIAVLVLKRN